MLTDSDVTEALRWIVGVFDDADVSHQLVGGCAAHAYGATRPLHDIDFYVPSAQLSSVASRVQEHVTFGPKRYQGKRWSLVYMKMRYNGVLVEVADAESTRFFDQRRQQWVEADVNFSASVHTKVHGVETSVISRKQLVAYKRQLDREVDRQDIREMLESYDGTAV